MVVTISNNTCRRFYWPFIIIPDVLLIPHEHWELGNCHGPPRPLGQPHLSPPLKLRGRIQESLHTQVKDSATDKKVTSLTKK